jgi:Arc/MetJ-type ribon-helix-helix transcriptional regulator
MEFELTPEQSDFVRMGIETGRYRDTSHAVGHALDQWVERERARMELLASLDTAEADGDDLVLDSQGDMDAFFEGIKQRGRDRLAAAK